MAGIAQSAAPGPVPGVHDNAQELALLRERWRVARRTLEALDGLGSDGVAVPAIGDSAQAARDVRQAWLKAGESARQAMEQARLAEREINDLDGQIRDQFPDCPTCLQPLPSCGH